MSKQVKIIPKPKSYFKSLPNLSDYEKEAKRFVWKSLEEEIPLLSGHKFNAAYWAIDYNAKNQRKNKIALYWHGEDNETKKYTFCFFYSLLQLSFLRLQGRHISHIWVPSQSFFFF